MAVTKGCLSGTQDALSLESSICVRSICVLEPISALCFSVGSWGETDTVAAVIIDREQW